MRDGPIASVTPPRGGDAPGPGGREGPRETAVGVRAPPGANVPAAFAQVPVRLVRADRLIANRGGPERGRPRPLPTPPSGVLLPRCIAVCLRRLETVALPCPSRWETGPLTRSSPVPQGCGAGPNPEGTGQLKGPAGSVLGKRTATAGDQPAALRRRVEPGLERRGGVSSCSDSEVRGLPVTPR